MHEVTLVSARPGSDLSDSISLSEVFQCLRTHRRHDPKPLRLHGVLWRRLLEGDVPAEVVQLADSARAKLSDGTGGFPEDNPHESVTIQVVPTSVRLTWVHDFETPEYEVEGWLLGDYENKIWVRIALRDNGSGDAMEGSIYRLRPGEHVGTERTPGVA